MSMRWIVAVTLIVAGCGGSSDQGTPAQGAAYGSCRDDGSCDSDLTCQDGRCLPSSSSGGSGQSGMTAEGAYAIRITPQTGMACSGAGAPFSVPSGADSFREITSPEAGGDSVQETPESSALQADGAQGFEISCRVQQTSPGAFSVDASIRSMGARFAVRGTVAGQTGTAFISELHQSAPGSTGGGTTLSQNDCAIRVRPRSDGTAVVGPGYIWADYECDAFADPPDDSCHAEGTFVFQNCEQ